MKNIQIETLKDFKFLQELKISEDNKTISFTRSKQDMEENTYKKKIYIYKTEEEKLLSFTKDDITRNFGFDENEKILFTAKEENNKKDSKENQLDKTKIYSLDLKGGERKLFMEIPALVTSFEKLDSDTYLVTYTEKPALAKEKTIDQDDYLVLDEIPYYYNGSGYQNKNRTGLALYKKSTNEFEKLTDKFTDVYSFDLNQDKTKALLVLTEFEKTINLKTKVVEIDLKTKEFKTLIDYKDGPSSAYYLEDKIVIIDKNDTSYGINAGARFFIFEDGKERPLEPDFFYNLGSSVNTDTKLASGKQVKKIGNKLYFLSTDEDTANLYSIDIKGKIEKVLAHTGSIDDFEIIGDKIYYIAIKEDRPQELYKMEDKKEERLTEINSFISDYKIAKTDVFEFENDGLKFKGYVVHPSIEVEGKKAGVLSIHGGPKTAFSLSIHHEMQALASEGYYVFFMNPRGSDGRGDDFMDIRGKYGDVDYKDLMKFTDLVLEKYPDIDKNRLGVMGGSYGGFMTNWIIGHTDRFKVAASQRCISNWISFHGTSDIGFYFAEDQTDSDPWKKTEKMWSMSPLKYADKVKTRTIFIHSDQDFRCPLEQGQQMFAALNYHGVDSKLVVFKGENHDLSRTGKPLHRQKRLREMFDWMGESLKEK